VPAVLIGNVLGVAALSWLLMPWLTRWLDAWLRR
jgi:antibiotic biosynthesis monooxygenase (ABM) superfamily enzyme